MSKMKNNIFKSGILALIIYNLTKTSAMMDLGSRGYSNSFYYHGHGRHGGFKANQRRERKLSRRRKMKPSAR